MHAQYEKKQETKRNEIKEKQNSIETQERAIKKFKYDLEEFSLLHQRESNANKNTYETELHRLDTEIQKYKNMLSSKPNSFKEFLNEEVDGWESELYPILDDALLDVSIEELKPKLLANEKPFGISLNKENLKHMLTKDEANAKIETLQAQKENVHESFAESLSKLELKFKNAQEEVEEKILFLSNDRRVLNEEILTRTQEIRALEEELLAKKEEEAKIYKTKENKYRQNIANLFLEIGYNEDAIKEVHKTLRTDRLQVGKLIEIHREEYESAIIESFKALNVWLKAQQNSINEAILQKEQEKLTITKDERVEQLERELAITKEELSQSIRAKEFLHEYDKSKDAINALAFKSSELQNFTFKNTEFKKRLELKIENYEYEMQECVEAKKAHAKTDKNLKKGLEDFELIRSEFESDMSSKESDEFLYVLIEQYRAVYLEFKNKKIDLKSKLDKINTLKNMQNEIEVHFNFEEYDEHLFLSQNILEKIEDIVDFKNKKLEMVKQSGHKKFINFVNNLLPQKMSIFSDSEDKFFSQVAKINKNLSEIDFGVIKNIKIDTKIGDKKSIAKLLNELNSTVSTLSSLLNESSLFYEKEGVLVELNRLEMKFKEIKSELKGNSISLQDTIDLTLSFNENGKQISEVSQLKNESSTGGSMLLKIAIAISILKLFITEDVTPFFLIVDEVSRLHSANQEKLREFANAKGFGIVFVTPEPTYSKPESIKYYRFRKNRDNEFEAIELNV